MVHAHTKCHYARHLTRRVSSLTFQDCITRTVSTYNKKYQEQIMLHVQGLLERGVPQGHVHI